MVFLAVSLQSVCVLVLHRKFFSSLGRTFRLTNLARKTWEMLPRASRVAAESLPMSCADGRGPVMVMWCLLLHPEPHMPFWEASQSE